MNRKALADWLAAGALALIVGVGYLYWQDTAGKDEILLPPVANCDLQRASCRATLPDGSALTLSFAPQPVPLLKPFDVVLQTSGAVSGPVEVDFTGVEMDMGFNRTSLQAGEGGRFAGQATLPVCVSGAMTWRVTVSLNAGGRRYAVPFKLSSEH